MVKSKQSDKIGTDAQEEKEELTEIEEELQQEDVRNDNEIDKLKNKLTECESNYKRALADYQNLQRRVQEEKIGWIQSANKDLLLKLLPILDTLMLAYKHLNDKGLELSIQQFLDILEKEGVRKIETIGKQFDPHTMEGVEIVEGENGKVIEEIRAGYMLYDKVIRPAQVKVGKKS